jgi:putative tryptophan/tyrosine transport system substrate-binding protein
MQFDQLKRRDFVKLLGGAAAWPLAAWAQRAGKFYRVAYLALDAGQDAVIVKQRLNELGYTAGKNLTFDFRSVEGHAERLPDLATELVRTNPDVIVAGFGTLTAKAAQAATTAIPIVFTSVGDPIGAGIVKNLNRPGANITGLTPQGTEITGKQLQILLETVPSIEIIAVLLNPDTPFSALALQELRIAADTQGRRLEICEVRMPDQLSSNIEAAARDGATGLMVLEDPLLLGLRQQIVDLAAKLRLPAAYGNSDFVYAGGLFSYGTDRRQLYRHAAELVDKVLQGEKPTDIPVERPTKFELMINLKTAKALDLSMPDKLLALADEVVE